MKKHIKKMVLFVQLITPALAIAALPQSGMWGVDAEFNGKPGRGIQIDRQGGDTIIASYYGYRSDGTATFYQAVGQVTNNGDFSADLIEYKNGTVLGGSQKTGETGKNMGELLIEFKTSGKGILTLPGENSKPFSIMTYENNKSLLSKSYRVINEKYILKPDDLFINNLRISLIENRLDIEMGNLTGVCRINAPLISSGAEFEIEGELRCISAGTSSIDKKFENIKISKDGDISFKISNFNVNFPEEMVNGKYTGKCIQSSVGINDTLSTVKSCSFD